MCADEMTREPVTEPVSGFRLDDQMFPPHVVCGMVMALNSPDMSNVHLGDSPVSMPRLGFRKVSDSRFVLTAASWAVATGDAPAMTIARNKMIRFIVVCIVYFLLFVSFTF